MTFWQANLKILVSKLLLINLLLPLSLLHSAEVDQGYKPPTSRGRLQRSEGSGSRGGCSYSLPVNLNLLTPQDHIPATVSPHPTFLWRISGQMPVTIEFVLVEPGVTQPLLKQRLEIERPGIVQLKLPSSSSPLEVGKEYRWTVSAICNENRPSENLYAFAWIERVPSSTELERKLKSASTQQEVALAYASSSVWYDALSILYDNLQNSSQQQLTSNGFWQLLNQVGLSQVVAQERQRLSTHFKLKAK